MAKTQTKTTTVEKVLGYFRKGTAIGDFAHALEDEKPHKLSLLLEKIKKDYKKNPEGRLAIFKKECKGRNLAGVLVDRDADTIQIKKGKGQPIPTKKAASVKAAKAVKANGSAKKTAKAEAISPVAKLVRKLLSNGKDWTAKDAVAEVAKENGIPKKLVSAAIASELRKGGLVETGDNITLS